MTDNAENKWLKIGVMVGLLLLDGVGIGGVFIHNEVDAVEKLQAELVAEEKSDNVKDFQLDKRLSLVEARLEAQERGKESHKHQPHVPGSACVCIYGNATAEKGKAEICELGESCDQNAITGCQALHKGATCQPLF